MIRYVSDLSSYAEQIATIAEFCAQRSNITDVELFLKEGKKRKQPGGGRMRLILWTLVAFALTIALIVYATRMWREGTHPKVKEKMTVSRFLRMPEAL